MTSLTSQCRRLLWLLPAVILILAVYNIKQLWPAKVEDVTFISTTFDIPGLGNLMFQYASLVGIASKSNKVAVLPANLRLCQIFDLPEIKWNNSRPGLLWGKVVEHRHSAYDDKIDRLKFDHNIEVVGYLQSWKYFDSYKKKLRRRLRFKAHVQKQAQSFLQTVYTAISTTSINPLFVGVHVRRGDYLKPENIKLGYTVADKNYTEKAMKYYVNKYPQNTVVFVVASDDLPWCKENMGSSKNIFFSENHADEVDLAILSHCNHMIMTVGTFGWWAAWLAGGEVTYFKDFPKINSRLSNSFSQTKNDYFPPHWIGI